jgi:segregation and condensation protein A
MKPDLTIVPTKAPAAAAPPVAALNAQAEMPFAVVEGQPMTELPRDLYIPPQALEIFL